ARDTTGFTRVVLQFQPTKKTGMPETPPASPPWCFSFNLRRRQGCPRHHRLQPYSLPGTANDSEK
ncbi:MAG: hypothetical protein WAV20_12425, partial [Blastocatellia bacterium]